MLYIAVILESLSGSNHGGWMGAELSPRSRLWRPRRSHSQKYSLTGVEGSDSGIKLLPDITQARGCVGFSAGHAVQS